MNIVTFTGYSYPVDKTNNTVKTNLFSNQDIKTASPSSNLIMPDAKLLQVSFTGSMLSKIGDLFSSESDIHPEYKKFILENKKISSDDKIIKLKGIFGDDFEGCPNDTQIPKKFGGIKIADIKPGADLYRKNLIRFNFVENNLTDIRGINLSSALLCYAVLNGVQISDEDHKAILTGAFLNNAELNGAKLNWAELKAARLSEVQLNGAELENANLYLTDLSRAKLNGAKLNDAKLYRARFIEADLEGAELKNTNLTWADLVRANLKGADLTNADLLQTDFQGAWFNDADLKDSKNINTADFNGAYYNIRTKFPKDFNPDDHGMIFISND